MDETIRKNGVDERAGFAGLLLGLSTGFIDIDPCEVDDAIDRALREIGAFTGVDRCYVFRFTDDGRMSNTHEWCGPGIKPAIHHLQDLPVDAFPVVTGPIREGRVFHAPDVNELPPGTDAERAEFEAEGIRSLVCAPLTTSGRVVGFVGFDSVRRKKAWSDDEIALLRIVGNMLSGALERKRSAEALRRSESKYRALVESSRQGIGILQDGRPVYANPALCEMTGRSADEILSLTEEDTLRMVHPEDRPRMERRFARRRDGREVTPIATFRLVRPNGSVRYLETVAAVIDYGGTPALQVSVTDRTDRRETAEALRKSEERFRALIENGEDAIALFDPEGRYLYYAGPSRYGIRSDTVEGKTPLDLFPPEEAIRLLAQIRRVVREGAPATVENEITIAGEKLWFSERITPVLGPEGRLEGVAKYSRNITGRRRAEDAVRESEENLRSLVENARGFVVYRIAADPHAPMGARVDFASPSIREILGVDDPEDFPSWFACAHPEDRARARRTLGVLSPAAHSAEFRVRRPGSDETRWVRFQSCPVVGGPLPDLFHNGLILDVTDQKRAEKELRDHQQMLESLVEERTAKLSESNELLMREILDRKEAERKIKKLNEELEERVRRRTEELERANEHLREIDRMKDGFLSTVSHELRTPLTSIRSFSEYLMSYDEDRATQKEFAEIINTESERLTRLINDVLDLSRIEAGGMTWNDEVVSMADVAADVARSQKQVIERKTVRLALDFPPGFPAARVDRDRMHQVLTNLVANALKFAPAETTITVGGELLDDGSAAWVRVFVADRGRGVAEKDREAIFEKFRQASGPAGADGPKGTGLGLPICREIVAHYGGRIWVESEPGAGSVFRFTLPVAERGASPGAAEAADDAPPSPNPVPINE